MAPLSSRAAPRHLVSTRRAPPSSPPRLVRVRNPQRLLPRTDAGAAARCGVRRRPAPAADPPGCVLAAWEASVGVVEHFCAARAITVRSDRFAVRNHNLNHGAIKPTMAFSL